MAATSPTSKVSAAAPRRGWFGRNWKWFIPLSLLVAFAIGGGTLFWVNFGRNLRLKNTQAYADTVKEVLASKRVQELLGDGIKVDTFLGMPSGNAEEQSITLRFPIKGSKGIGDVQSMSRRIDDKWALGQLVVTVGKDEVNLMKEINARSGDDTPKFNPTSNGTPAQTNDQPPDINLDVGGATK